ncbi:MAG: hypothetical protein HYV08_12280 [Deltaproteobacteria bacterium]|nr:hypothetical protein [Deltaproteobacteria bacterium]
MFEDLQLKPFFAQRVQQASALGSHILGKLKEADAYVGIMHRRGRIVYPGQGHEKDWKYRGSVWIHQELAIIAYLNDVLGRSIPAALFMQSEIEWEGVMTTLILNPTYFETQDDLLPRVEQWVKDTLRDRPEFDYLRAKFERRTDGFGAAEWKFLRLCMAMGERIDWEQIKREFESEYRDDPDFVEAGRRAAFETIDDPVKKAFHFLIQKSRDAELINPPRPDESSPSRQSFNIVPMWRPLLTMRLRDLGYL